MRIAEYIGLGKFIDPRDQHVQIRVVSAGQRNLSLFRCAVIRDRLPLKIDIKFIFDIFGEAVLGQIRVCTRLGKDFDRNRFGGFSCPGTLGRLPFVLEAPSESC